MHVDGTLAEVVEYQILLDFADTADRALEHFLDEDAFLRVHNLIVALFELAVDLDVLDVEDSVVGEAFFKSPVFTVLVDREKSVISNLVLSTPEI